MANSFSVRHEHVISVDEGRLEVSLDEDGDLKIYHTDTGDTNYVVWQDIPEFIKALTALAT